MVGVSDEHVAQAQNRERASWGPREALAQFTINPLITKYNLFGSKILLGRREDHSLKCKGLGRFILKHPRLHQSLLKITLKNIFQKKFFSRKKIVFQYT